MSSLESQVKQIRVFSSALREYLDSSFNNECEKLLFVRKRLVTFLKDSNNFKEFDLEPHLVRGSIAETMFYYVIEYYKSKNPDCFLLEGLLIPTNNGTTQIDSVLLTDKGIYVIEVKSLFGDIIVKDGEILQLKNNNKITPWSQNKGHIGALASISTLPWEWFHNIVYVFSLGTLNEYYPRKDEILLVNRNVLKFLEEQESKKKIADFRVMRGEAEKLKLFIPSIQDEAEHIRKLKDKFKESE